MFWDKKKEPVPVVGEVYAISTGYGIYPIHDVTGIQGYPVWIEFAAHQATDGHDGFIKIRGTFHKRENVFFYTDVYTPLREKIQNKKAPG